MSLINGRDVSIIANNEILDFMSNKTGLSKENLNLIIETFTFFLKKELMEIGRIYVCNLGEFLIKPYSIQEKILKNLRRRHSIKFISSKYFRIIMEGEKDIPLEKFAAKKDFLKELNTLFGIKFKDAKFLFGLYFFCVVTYLRKYGECRISKFGKLIFKVDPKDPESKKIFFIPGQTTLKELNKNHKNFYLSPRLKRMFYLCGISRQVIVKNLGRKINKC